MKRLICILLSLIMLLSVFTACGKDDGNGGNNADGGSDSEQKGGDNGKKDEPGVDQTPKGDDPEGLEYSEYDVEGYHIYVSTTGKDSNDGKTEATAVKTIEKANTLAREYMNNNGDSGAKENIVISLGKGNYYISSPITPVSGNSKYTVHYTSRGGYAKLIGGLRIDSSCIKLCEDDDILSKVRDDTAREYLYEVDLSKYDYYFTTLEAKAAKTNVSDLSNAKFTVYRCLQFTSGDSLLTPARWPNADESYTNSTVNKSDKCIGYLTTSYINYTQKGQYLTPTQVNNLGLSTTLPMNIFVDDNTYRRISSWDFDNEEIFSSDFFSNHWDDRNHRITGFNSTAFKAPNGITYKGSISTDYGRVYNNEMATADAYGNSDFRRWYFYNVLEEIDVAGEFYLDTPNKKMYYYPGEDVEIGDVTISTSKLAILSCVGSTYKGFENVQFHNMCIRNSQSSLIHISYGNKIVFDGCEIGNSAGDGIDIDHSTNITVKNCDIHSFGCNAIYIIDCEPLDPTKEITLANIIFENCNVHDLGIVHHSYARAFTFSNTSGVTVRKCRIYDGPHGAFALANSANLIVEYNEVYKFLEETDDSGLIYGYDSEVDNQIGITFRYNYIHDIGAAWQPQGITIFYQDSYTIAYQIHDNIIENISNGTDTPFNIFGSMFAGHAYDNIVANVSTRTKITTSDKRLWNNQLCWWRILYSADTYENNGVFDREAEKLYDQFSTINSGFYTTWANSIAATDEELGATYKALVRLRSRDFFCDMFGHLLLVFNPDDLLADGCCEAFFGSDLDGITVVLSSNCAAVKSSKYAADSQFTVKSGKFTDIDSLFKWMYDELGYNENCFEEGYLPIGVSMYYNGVKAKKIYANKYTPDGLGDWKLSSTATALGLTDTAKDFFKAKGTGGYATNVAVYYLASDAGYFSEYTHNITINCPYDFSCTDWDSPTIKATKYYDADGLSIDVVKDGKYTDEFIDYYNDICDSGKFEYKQLPDVTLMGSSLPR